MSPELKQNNYIYASNFLSRDETSELIEAFLDAEKNKKLLPDAMCPISPAIYNMLPCVKMLVKKIPDVSKLCGAEVLPTYTYGRVYNKGEVLNRHRDRDACEISLTVNLEKDEIDWPIWIEKPNGEEVSHTLNPGDALLYLGCTADHWRKVYEGKRHMQVFFHYVMAESPRARTFFDLSF